MSKKRQSGFTLIEVIVSSAIAVIVMTTIGSLLFLLRSAITEEGVVNDATGVAYPLAPSASQTPIAFSIVGEAQASGNSAAWCMVTDKPIQLPITPASAVISGIASASPNTLLSPSGFRGVLQGAGIGFLTQSGFSIVFFSDAEQVSGYLTVTWQDVSGYRLYSVGSYSGLSPDPLLKYDFAEPIAYVQTSPSATILNRGGNASSLQIVFPDPSNRYGLNATRLARTIGDPSMLASQIALLANSHGITLDLPMTQ